jgi:hypothetical protein
LASEPLEVTLSIRPTARFEIIDVARLLSAEFGDGLAQFRKALYCSFHTTAGYLEQGFCARLGHSARQLDPFFRLVQRIFPPDAGYFHDRIQLREELSESEKESEPINADSHLTFMGAGLKNCVIYRNRPDQPVYFIELDGIYKENRRHRRTTALFYRQEEIVYRGRLALPVSSGHVIDSFNLKDPRYGLFEQLGERLSAHGIRKGRIDIRLAPEERHVGLTVNEYETLLMRDDLPQVLHDPLRYMVQHGKRLLRNPGTIPGKTRGYATYDLIHLYNEFLDSLPVGRAVVDRVFSFLSSPASRILRLKRQISLLVSDAGGQGVGRIVQGQYQSPILVQHQPAERGVRYLDVAVRRFK